MEIYVTTKKMTSRTRHQSGGCPLTIDHHYPRVIKSTLEFVKATGRLDI